MLRLKQSPSELNDLAKAHRFSIWAIIAGFLGAVAHIYVALAAIPFHLYGALMVGRCLRIHPIALVLIGLLMIVPVANTLALFLLNNRAGRSLREAGLHLGPMGISESALKSINQKLY